MGCAFDELIREARVDLVYHHLNLKKRCHLDFVS
jgi:hypothetical protein